MADQAGKGAETCDAAPHHDEIGPQLHRVLSYHRLPAPSGPPPATGTPRGSHSHRRPHRIRPLPHRDRTGSARTARAAARPKNNSRAARSSSAAPPCGACTACAIARALPRLECILIPDGERAKTLQTASRVYDALVTAQADRGAGIVAVGGGVIGDTAGFAAATYLRGIRVAHVPTTLLAQVDSAVGGKVGVNHALGKNLIGAFHQPQARRRSIRSCSRRCRGASSAPASTRW